LWSAEPCGEQALCGEQNLVVSTPSVVSKNFVVSRLALRWGAKRPLGQTIESFWKHAVTVLGLLRSPTQGKPAHHKGPICYIEFVHTKGLLST
jgi:hypothetical protein